MSFFSQRAPRTTLARPVTREGLTAVYRYRDPEDVQRDLEALLADGLGDGRRRLSR
jgi:hypothetical protein